VADYAVRDACGVFIWCNFSILLVANDPKSQRVAQPAALKNRAPRQHGKESRLDPTDSGCFRDRRQRAGQKTLDRVASLGNFEVKRQAYLGNVGSCSAMFGE
jgi:hypothetical protein